MTFEELKAMRENADKIISTFRNDRAVICETRDRLYEQRDCSYEEIKEQFFEIAKDMTSLGKVSSDEKIRFTLPVYRGFSAVEVSDDSDGSIRIKFDLKDKSYLVLIFTGTGCTKRWVEYNCSYAIEREDNAKVQIISHKEKFIQALQELYEKRILVTIEAERRKNDSLISHVETLKSAVEA